MSQPVRLVLVIAATTLVVLGLLGAVWFFVTPGQSSLAAAPQAVVATTAAATPAATPAGTAAAAASAVTATVTAKVATAVAAAQPVTATSVVTPTAEPAPTAPAPATAAPASPLPAPAAPITAALDADAHGTALAAPQLYTYKVVAVYPHDPAAFTQGLIVRDGVFYEGTGREGQSSLRRVDIPSGKVLELQKLPDDVFGEGITELDGKLYQLTWQNQAGFVYDLDTLAQTGQFAYTGEGWGITTDGEQLIVSDGSQTIQFWDPQTLQPTHGIVVSLLGFPLTQLNELEYIDGQIFANIWQTNLVVRIDPATGNVTGVVDLGGLLGYAPPATSQFDVLNGIAYDAATGRLFVTGKLWPAVFEIKLVEVPPQP